MQQSQHHLRTGLLLRSLVLFGQSGTFQSLLKLGPQPKLLVCNHLWSELVEGRARHSASAIQLQPPCSCCRAPAWAESTSDLAA